MDSVADVLGAAAADLTRSFDLPLVLEKLLGRLAQIVPYDTARILRLDEEGRLVVEAHQGPSNGDDGDRARPGDVETPHPLFQTLLAESRSLLIPDTRGHPEWPGAAGARDVRSWLGVPLIESDQLVGALAVEKAEPGFFTERHVQLAEAMGASVASAIRKSRLLEDLRRSDERLQRQLTDFQTLAYRDVVSDLPNRRLFQDRLALAVAQAHRHKKPLAVLVLDLDRFKVINDSLGHSVGDRLIRELSIRLRTCLREGDTVARLGGDEFTLLLPDIGQVVDAAKVAAKVLELVRRPFEIDGRELFVTGSLGISLYPDDGQDAETLVKNAETAMYRAKEHSRDNYQLYTPAMNASALQRLKLENALRKALSQDELVLYYQPMFDRTGRIHGTEALMRWRHPELGLVPPADFIPIAELTGLILPMGPWVLRSACAQAWIWQERYPGLSVAVNLSARQFQEPGLVAQVTDALGDTGLEPRLLELEITESNAMQNASSAIETLRELKELGVRLSIDDFGTGYSSLSYLRRFPIDTLKIDQSFVRDIGGDADGTAITSAVIALAHTLKLEVVAEGVETRGQLDFLAASGCDRMQGYLFSPPVPADRCEALLAAPARAS